MILKTRGGNVELRSTEWGTSHLISRSAWMSDVGQPVTERDAFGLPAVGNVIRSAAGLVASLPFFVYTDDGDTHTPARDSWQWKLLHDRPSEYCSVFDFFYDVALSVEATQNAFVRKTRLRDQIIDLEVLDPHRVTVKVDRRTGEKLFDVWVQEGNVVENLTSKEILHVRGYSTPGGYCGVSLIQVHANTLGSQRAMQRFEGDYFRKGGIPPFWFTGAANAAHAKEIVDGFKANRERAMNGDPGGLWGQIDVKSIPISMADAQYVEAKQMTTEDACAIWDWPVWMVTGDTDAGIDTNARMSEFLRTKFLPRLRRIEQAFNNDQDFFSNKPMFGEFLTAALERADFVTRTRGYKDARQGSWITANEIRKLENLPPLDGGDELQQTPVGGAPNPPAGSPTQGNPND